MLTHAVHAIKRCGPPLVENTWCGLCNGVMFGFAHIEATGHMDTCPWLSMPKIIDALDILAEFAEYKNWVGGGEYDGPSGGLQRARIALGMDQPDDDDDD